MRIPVFVLLLLLLLLFSSRLSSAQDDGEQVAPVTGVEPLASPRELVPAMFVFGDSLIDNGNNNNLPSFAKANYFPYGIDFPDGPTGRFSNGYTIVDELANLLGLPLIPAHSEAQGEDVYHGVNYASAASGILDITGRNFVDRIPFNQQIKNFEATLDEFTDWLGADAVADSIARCIFFIGMGSNDYLNNYLMPNYDTRNRYNPLQFADLLANQYQRQILSLYNLGARKIVISGVGMLGCIPSILAQTFANRCSSDVNSLAVPFNDKVKAMVNTLNTNFSRAKFIYVDIYRMFGDIISQPLSYGLREISVGCCGVGRNRGQITCLPYETPCRDRDRYIFWDAFHPTAAVNIILARKAFAGDRSYVFPMNIQQLAAMEIQQD